jgi:hypothetical protein
MRLAQQRARFGRIDAGDCLHRRRAHGNRRLQREVRLQFAQLLLGRQLGKRFDGGLRLRLFSVHALVGVFRWLIDQAHDRRRAHQQRQPCP